ncbi:uncharacterized protein METZ01_LOCUS262706 [marine metagenome]|uniref:Uncharacterized protein n=1 Tax=marine metagenome TaxID=408172 RepID=A0A382JER5_9ZZZZ
MTNPNKCSFQQTVAQLGTLLLNCGTKNPIQQT